MRAHIFLTITRSGVVKMTQQKPTLARGQRSIRLVVSVPDSAFAEPAILDAELQVPADALAYPAVTEPLKVEVWPEP
jgi:hypothetical protein